MPLWKPGDIVNPRGRPAGIKGLAQAIRRRSGYGDELVDFLFKVFRNENDKKEAGRGIYSHAHQMEALTILLDRGFGKAMQMIHLSEDQDGSALDLSALSDDDLAAIATTLAKARVIDVPSSEH